MKLYNKKTKKRKRSKLKGGTLTIEDIKNFKKLIESLTDKINNFKRKAISLRDDGNNEEGLKNLLF